MPDPPAATAFNGRASPTGTTGTAGVRENHLDALRAFLMLLGIPYHAALPFRDDGQAWLVLSDDRSRALTYLIEFLHLFRMQGFFLIADYFTAMLLLKRTPGAYLRSRLVRLLPPLMTGLLVIVPLMNLATDAQYPSRPAAILTTWMDQSLTLGRHTTGHLWFVIVLVYYSAIVAVLALSHKMRIFRLDLPEGAVAKVFPLALIAAGLIVGGYEVALLKVAPFVPVLLIQPFSLGFALEYAPYFAVGILIHRVPALNACFNRVSWTIVIVAIACALIAVGADELPPYTRPILRAVAAIAMTQSIVALAARTFVRPSRGVSEMVDASFTIYLLHLPIIIVAFPFVEPVPAPYLVRYVLLIAIAFTGSFLGWMLVKRSAGLLFWTSGVRIKHA